MGEVRRSVFDAVWTINTSRLSPYRLGTPHRRKDIDDWPAIAIKITTVDFDDDNPEVKRLKRSGQVSYAMVDRGVSRAQGLLQFNSIVFAAVAILSTIPNLSWGTKVVFVVATLPLIASTLLSLCCLWTIWYAPSDHADPEKEALFNWEVWIKRSLLLNVSLLLSGASFLLISLILLICIAL